MWWQKQKPLCLIFLLWPCGQMFLWRIMQKFWFHWFGAGFRLSNIFSSIHVCYYFVELVACLCSLHMPTRSFSTYNSYTLSPKACISSRTHVISLKWACALLLLDTLVLCRLFLLVIHDMFLLKQIIWKCFISCLQPNFWLVTCAEKWCICDGAFPPWHCMPSNVIIHFDITTSEINFIWLFKIINWFYMTPT